MTATAWPCRTTGIDSSRTGRSSRHSVSRSRTIRHSAKACSRISARARVALIPTWSSKKTIWPVVGRTCATASHCTGDRRTQMTRSAKDRSDSSCQSPTSRCSHSESAPFNPECSWRSSASVGTARDYPAGRLPRPPASTVWSCCTSCRRWCCYHHIQRDRTRDMSRDMTCDMTCEDSGGSGGLAGAEHRAQRPEGNRQGSQPRVVEALDTVQRGLGPLQRVPVGVRPVLEPLRRGVTAVAGDEDRPGERLEHRVEVVAHRPAGQGVPPVVTRQLADQGEHLVDGELL